MKKFISILLTVAIMFSLSIISFAAEPTIELGQDYTVTAGGETLTYSFVVPETGMFKLTANLISEEDNISASITVSSDTDSYSSAYLYRFETDEIDGFAFVSTQASDYFVAKAGDVLTVEVCREYEWIFENSDISNIRLSFSISLANDCRELSIGNNYSVSTDGEYFIIRPTTATIYNLWSYDSGFVSVMGSDGSFYSSSYYHDDFGLDFSFKAKAGEVYGVCVSPDYYSEYEEESEAYSMILNVVDGSTIKPNFIELEDITVAKGSQTWVDLYVLPFGSSCNYDELIFELGDNEIASLEYDSETGTIWVTGEKIGKTTLKVTEPISGVTTEVELEVASNSTILFRNIIDSIISFFIDIGNFFVELINLF